MRLPLLLVLPLALAACAPRGGAGLEAAPDGRVATEAGLEAALARSGFVLSPRGFTTDPLVSATANEYVVGGTGRGYLQVYTFDSADRAARGADDVARSGSVSARVYQNGPLVVAYYGSDAALGASLTRFLGTPRL